MAFVVPLALNTKPKSHYIMQKRKQVINYPFLMHAYFSIPPTTHTKKYLLCLKIYRNIVRSGIILTHLVTFHI